MSIFSISEQCDISQVSNKLSQELQKEYTIKEEIDNFAKNKYILYTELHRNGVYAGRIVTIYAENGEKVKKDLDSKTIWIERLETFKEGLNLGRILVCYHACKFFKKGYTDVHLQAGSSLFKEGKVKSEEEADEILFKYYRTMGFQRREPMEFNLMKAKLSDIIKYCGNKETLLYSKLLSLINIVLPYFKSADDLCLILANMDERMNCYDNKIYEIVGRSQKETIKLFLKSGDKNFSIWLIEEFKKKYIPILKEDIDKFLSISFVTTISDLLAQPDYKWILISLLKIYKIKGIYDFQFEYITKNTPNPIYRSASILKDIFEKSDDPIDYSSSIRFLFRKTRKTIKEHTELLIKLEILRILNYNNREKCITLSKSIDDYKIDKIYSFFISKNSYPEEYKYKYVYDYITQDIGVYPNPDIYVDLIEVYYNKVKDKSVDYDSFAQELKNRHAKLNDKYDSKFDDYFNKKKDGIREKYSDDPVVNMIVINMYKINHSLFKKYKKYIVLIIHPDKCGNTDSKAKFEEFKTEYPNEIEMIEFLKSVINNPSQEKCTEIFKWFNTLMSIKTNY